MSIPRTFRKRLGSARHAATAALCVLLLPVLAASDQSATESLWIGSEGDVQAGLGESSVLSTVAPGGDAGAGHQEPLGIGPDDKSPASILQRSDELVPVVAVLIPRMPLVKGFVPRQPKFVHRLIVKFRDQLLARAVDGRVLTLDGEVDLVPARLKRRQPVRFKPLLDLPPEMIAWLETRAAANSGLAQPDLASMMLVEADPAALGDIAALLHASELVEWAEFEMVNPLPPLVQEPCFDIAPVTPTYESLQGYRGANPGLNMNAFWSLGSGRGFGIRVADCEYWFHGDHEDLCGVIAEPGQTPNPGVVSNGWHHHGSAVLGEMIGADNAYGVRGLVLEAQAWVFPRVDRGRRLAPRHGDCQRHRYGRRR